MSKIMKNGRVYGGTQSGGTSYVAGSGIEIASGDVLNVLVDDESLHFDPTYNYAYVDGKYRTIFVGTQSAWDALTSEVKATYELVCINDAPDWTGNIDSTPTENSNNAVSSGSVYTAIEGLNTAKQNKTLDTPLTIGGTSQTTVEGALGGLNTNKIDVSSGICAHGTNEPFMAGQPIRDYLLGLDSSIKFATFTVDPTASTVTDKINATEYFSYNCYKQGASWRVVAISSNGGKMYIADVSSSTTGITWQKIATESDILPKTYSTSLDANNCTESGYYATVTSNVPINGYGFSLFAEISKANNYCHQTAKQFIANDEPSVTYVRKGRYLDNAWVWSSWEKLVTESEMKKERYIDVSVYTSGKNVDVNKLRTDYGTGVYILDVSGATSAGGYTLIIDSTRYVIYGAYNGTFGGLANQANPLDLSGVSANIQGVYRIWKMATV